MCLTCIATCRLIRLHILSSCNTFVLTRMAMCRPIRQHVVSSCNTFVLTRIATRRLIRQRVVSRRLQPRLLHAKRLVQPGGSSSLPLCQHDTVQGQPLALANM